MPTYSKNRKIILFVLFSLLQNISARDIRPLQQQQLLLKHRLQRYIANKDLENYINYAYSKYPIDGFKNYNNREIVSGDNKLEGLDEGNVNDARVMEKKTSFTEKEMRATYGDKLVDDMIRDNELKAPSPTMRFGSG